MPMKFHLLLVGVCQTCRQRLLLLSQTSLACRSKKMARVICNRPLGLKTSLIICTLFSTPLPIAHVIQSFLRWTFHACHSPQTVTCFVSCVSWVTGWLSCT